jgi:hypothetical protein
VTRRKLAVEIAMVNVETFFWRTCGIGNIFLNWQSISASRLRNSTVVVEGITNCVAEISNSVLL